MKNFETVFHLPGDLSHGGKKMKLFNFFQEDFSILGGFTLRGDKMKGKNHV